MRLLILGITLFFCSLANAQLNPYDSTKVLQKINTYGNDNNNGRFRGSLILPRDTFRLAQRDSSSVAVVGNILYIWNGSKWGLNTGNGSSAGGYTDTQYLRRDINSNLVKITQNALDIKDRIITLRNNGGIIEGLKDGVYVTMFNLPAQIDTQYLRRDINLKASQKGLNDSSAAIRASIPAPVDTQFIRRDLNLKASQQALIDTAAAIRSRQLADGTLQILAGGIISSLPAIGNNPGTNITTKDFIISQFYASQPPTAGISGGGTYEYTTAGSTARTLNWTAGRQSATATLSTIVVAGVTQTFTQPAQPGTVSGTQSVSVPNNANTNYNNTVTTTDGKTASATTTFTYQNKIYAGFVLSATPTDGDIIAATGSGYVGGQFSASRNQSGSLSAPSSSKYYVFVSPATYGTPNIVINGLGVTFNQTTRSFTNASGGITSYIIAISPFPTAGQIDTYLVN